MLPPLEPVAIARSTTTRSEQSGADKQQWTVGGKTNDPHPAVDHQEIAFRCKQLGHVLVDTRGALRGYLLLAGD